MTASLISDVLPELAAELAAGLGELGEEALARQVGSLRVVARCECGESLCASFHTAPPPGDYGERYRTVPVPVKRGMVILAVVRDRIVFVEVLGRGDVRAQLRDLAG